MEGEWVSFMLIEPGCSFRPFGDLSEEGIHKGNLTDMPFGFIVVDDDRVWNFDNREVFFFTGVSAQDIFLRALEANG